MAEEQSLRAVVEALEASYEAVRVWHHECQGGGVEAACAQAPVGAKPRLSPEQLDQLAVALPQGSCHWRYQTELGALARIADLIHRSLGVRHHPSHVLKLLRGTGWSCQRPTLTGKCPADSPADSIAELDGHLRLSVRRVRWQVARTAPLAGIAEHGFACCWGGVPRPTCREMTPFPWRMPGMWALGVNA